MHGRIASVVTVSDGPDSTVDQRNTDKVEIILDHIDLETFYRQSSVSQLLNEWVVCEFFPDGLDVFSLE